ncbi:sulfurtransferase TusA family protein [Gallaecimonas xiamenensis]|uniref:UPF0033 domain-containing protein n=1 Tax=Gallaecimonas xiamenensis 3-C-1 TaxID=745411 RepID=K2J025_9GAMM|nr:sulfurtransferase TusA family protein [Gallaecimonas xiamenensis]EKE76181.1 hypothetical protein B3C1_04715 [Gallaecimonas xiamenensis 3-C-1]
MQHDLRRYRCPMALVQAKIAIGRWPGDAPLVLLLAEKASTEDLCRWLCAQGQPFERHDSPGFFQVCLTPRVPDSAPSQHAQEMQ